MEEDYLEILREKIDKKDLHEFWIACYKSEYKPMTITKKELLDTINKNLNRYIGKNFAYISIFIKKGIKNYDINHPEVFSIKVTIFQVDDDGKFIKDGIRSWGCLIKYDLFDLLDRKFSLKDLYIIVKAVYDRILESDSLTGRSYNNMLKIFNKHKIDF